MTSEIKFLITRETGTRIRDWARRQLDADPNGRGPFGDTYRTSTLYFETADFDVFHRRGSFGRSKYRIRRYDGEPAVFLERKLRQSARLSKRRTTVPLAELGRLSRSGGEWPGTWFQQRLQLRALRPVCQISYERVARVGATSSGPIRLTVDDDIRALIRADAAFSATRGLPVLANRMVLEVKYGGAMPALVRQLVDEFSLMPVHASKYRRTVGALGLAREDAAATASLSAAVATCA